MPSLIFAYLEAQNTLHVSFAVLQSNLEGGENCKNGIWNNALRKFAISNIDIGKIGL